MENKSLETTFIYSAARTMDACSAPHVTEFHATRVVGKTHYSSWGYAVECAACGQRKENPGASAVSAMDAPARFAREHRDCLPIWQREKLEREHLIAEVAQISAELAEGRIVHHYAKELERVGKRLQALTRW
jgi:hypothetical protein